MLAPFIFTLTLFLGPSLGGPLTIPIVRPTQETCVRLQKLLVSQLSAFSIGYAMTPCEAVPAPAVNPPAVNS